MDRQSRMKQRQRASQFAALVTFVLFTILIGAVYALLAERIFGDNGYVCQQASVLEAQQLHCTIK